VIKVIYTKNDDLIINTYKTIQKFEEIESKMTFDEAVAGQRLDTNIGSTLLEKDLVDIQNLGK